MTPGQRITQAREAAGLTQEGLGKTLKVTRVSVSNWERDQNLPKGKRLEAVATALGVSIPWILSGSGEGPQFERKTALNQPHNPDDNLEQLTSNVRGQLIEKTRDTDWHKREMIRVMGTGQGGDGDGFFEWNGEVIDHVKRPPQLDGRQRVFAIYLAGDSMYPALRDGALIYVDANLKPRIGRDVLIELKPPADGEAPKALVKRVVALGSDFIKVEQFNPPRTFTIRKDDIRHAYLVLEIEELV